MNAAELFLNIIDYDMLLDIADSKKLLINGFKNIRKAPEFIVRKTISFKFSHRPSMLISILEDYYGSKLKELKKETVEDFIYNFLSYPLRDSIPNHVALGMIILSFPEYSEKMVDKFYENIENNRHIFYGCVDSPVITDENCYLSINKVLQLSDEIEWVDILIIKIEKILEKIKRMEDYKKLYKEFKGLSFYDFSIKFYKLREEFPDYMPLLAFIKANKNVIKESKEEIRDFYRKLIFKVYDCVVFEVLTENENRIKENVIEIRGLEETNRLYEKKLVNFESEYKVIDNKSKEYQEKIKHLLNFYEGQINEVKEQEAADLEMNYESLIITSYGFDRVFDVIGSYNILHPNKISLLEKILDEFSGTVFIDRNSIETTKELIEIERLIKQKNNKKVVLWSKSIEELVRNIIITKIKLGG
jgi:hypothetical protein